jgi:hypothetical protein
MKSLRVFGAIIIVALTQGAFAQDDEPTIKIKKKPPVTSTPDKPPRRAGNYKAGTAAATAKTTVSTGSLSVVAAPGATVYLEAHEGRGDADNRKELIPPNRGQVIFNDLKPGRYRVSVELAGYEDAAGQDEKDVVIKARLSEGVEFRLRPIIHKVVIETNVESGEVRYGVAGEAKRIERFQGRQIKLSLAAGKYGIEIEPADVGYRPDKQIIEIGPDKTEFEATLKRLESTVEFSPNWTAEEFKGWEAPASWSVAARKLLAKGRGVALPREESVRHYADFELTCNLRMLNDTAVSFVLRAQDKQNYYLVQLARSEDKKDYSLKGFAVVNGVERVLQSPIPFAANFSTFFRVTINFTGNKLSVKVIDSTGEEIPLGELTDVNHRFASGAVGLAVRGLEEMEVEFFHVRPLARGAR